MTPVWERCLCPQGYRWLAINFQAVETGIEEELLTSSHLDKAHKDMEAKVGEIPELISHEPLLQPAMLSAETGLWECEHHDNSQ